MQQIKQGIDKGTLNKFKLMPTTEAISDIRIEGRILKYCENSREILVRMSGECFAYLISHQHLEYELTFKNNQQTFAIQHQAVEVLLKQSLFSCIIANEQYDENASFDDVENDYHFRQLSEDSINNFTK